MLSLALSCVTLKRFVTRHVYHSENIDYAKDLKNSLHVLSLKGAEYIR
jgi:hypothetical protein